ncbi:glycosyltransferase family 2 protein [Hymenobacter profundi]|uniref:Glycosyltransferase n=1 Tax=Hymenobacter profundi TaxID=1982110 RepID=A0ABS6WXL6_9BACT|nr:glycosyltransferase [Hymenobacter profundi]MBW3128256.1 glycosyltransferase [Hymenobacter profundi]
MHSEVPLVSVRVITYNHGRFLRECLDGIMAQETSFPFEVVIGEDCSTDNTRQICQEFQARYPDTIRLLLHAQNVGAQANARLAREACAGKYIAFCEGDDYWTDPTKLQQQVDFLEANPAYVLCFHNCWMKFEQQPDREMELFHDYTKADYAIPDLIGKWLIPTASVVFRNHLFTEYPEWLRNAVVGDTPFYILLASFGSLKLVPGIMAVYRRHDGGATNLLHGYRYWERMIELYCAINEHFKHRYSKEIIPVLKWFHYKLTQLALQDNDFEKYRHYAQRSLLFNTKMLLRYQHIGIFHYRIAFMGLTAISPLFFKVRVQRQVQNKA